MSTILKALRRLEEDRSPGSSDAESTTDSVRATDPGATDELRDRILTEEAVAQAVAAVAQRDSDRKRRLIVKSGTAVVLAIGLGVGVYTIMSAGLDPEPIPDVVAIGSEPGSAPKVEALRAGEGFAGIASPRATSERTADSPTRVAPTLSRFANVRRPNRPETYEGNETGGFPSEQAQADSRSPALPVPIMIPVADDSIAASNSPSVVSRSTPGESPAPSAAAGSVTQHASTPPSAAGEMAAAAVTPTPASLAANSPRTVAGNDTSLAKEPVESTPPRRRPAPTTTAKAPPKVSARQSASSTPASSTATASPKSVAKSKPAASQTSRPARESEPSKKPQPLIESQPSITSQPQKSQALRKSQPNPESSSIARLDRPDLPDLTIIRTAWHPSADRRTAKIRLEDTDEIMNLREGDAIGGLVIKEISPSAVLFKAGDVEVRHRVGRPGSGG